MKNDCTIYKYTNALLEQLEAKYNEKACFVKYKHTQYRNIQSSANDGVVKRTLPH